MTIKSVYRQLLQRAGDEYQTIKSWHVVIAAAFLLQVIIFLMFSNSFYIPIDIEYLSHNVATGQFETAVRSISEVSLVWVVAVLLLGQVLLYVLLASVWFERYKLTLSLGKNRFRWLGYSFSRGVLLVTVGLLLGISNLALLFLIFMTAFVLGFFSVFVDTIFKKLSKRLIRLTRVITWASILMPWAVFAAYAFNNWLYDSSISVNKYLIIFTVLIYFLAYDFNFIYQRLGRGRWSAYLYGEKVYLLLSFVLQSAIVWQIFSLINWQA